MEFLTDDEAAGFGRYAGVPSRADLERVFFLDDEDRTLIDRHRGEHMKLGFALQLVTVRWVGASWKIRSMCRWRCWTSWPNSWRSPIRRA